LNITFRNEVFDFARLKMVEVVYIDVNEADKDRARGKRVISSATRDGCVAVWGLSSLKTIANADVSMILCVLVRLLEGPNLLGWVNTSGPPYFLASF